MIRSKTAALFAATGILTMGVFGCASKTVKTAGAPTAAADPYLWLEEIESARSLDWVRARNAKAEAEIVGSKEFKPIEDDIRKVVLAPDRLPLGSYRGGFIYNFWQDDENVRGLWRRTTLAEYAKPEPKWDAILDLDVLAKEENENWVWKEAYCLPPDGKRCLLSLSRGGKDAAVLREFDVPSKSFVSGGFFAPEAKWRAAWANEDAIWIGTDMGAGSLTKSGYPRQARYWRRGERLEQSKLVYEGQESDVAVSAFASSRPEGTRQFIERSIDFFRSEVFLVGDDLSLSKIPVPEDADFMGTFEDRAFFLMRSAWRSGGFEFSNGSVIAVSLKDLKARPESVYVPGPRAAAQSLESTRSQLVLSVIDNVHPKPLRLRREPSGWKAEPLFATPKGLSVRLQASNAFDDTAVVYETGFLTPPSLRAVDLSAKRPKLSPLRSLPERFDARGMIAEQLEARSKDGTKIPYFVIRPKSLKRDGSTPTLLYGYGGFQISMLPEYVGAVGKFWVERRNAVYVVANIRGGGEFGPQWHQAALREKRQRAFDDFAAVAKDLIARKITSPAHLGIMGGSNGGLLVGTTFTQRPELFGAVVCQVPLLDMLRYTKLLAGASWVAEYGDPEDPRAAEAIASYSPYQKASDHVKYPPILFLTSTKDDRVHPGHARKMMAKLESFGAPALLWENIEGGHGGAANLEQRVKFSALGWTFLANKLGGKAPAEPKAP